MDAKTTSYKSKITRWFYKPRGYAKPYKHEVTNIELLYGTLHNDNATRTRKSNSINTNTELSDVPMAGEKLAVNKWML